ncbi:recombinase family protein [Roseibium sediminicola]|uniref:Recombinase family protein n=1 Tax=Roseibium sediminicola TaxID=2933272 RepID=A0ABT0GP78_9HYPH|nr:recombinase family protein [Roseibium sp. CAU 1639]MCK7611126.1 recombinase family protein [Roseibium sp. CAU 1639]
MPKKTPAIAYTRVSTKRQKDQGAGLDLQMTSIEAFADRAGFEIVDRFSDAHTGVGEDSIKNRPGIIAALNRQRETRYPILVDNFDRISRNTNSIQRLASEGRLHVIACRNDHSDKAAVMIAETSYAQARAERISKSTKRGLQMARERGVTLGNTKNLKEAQKKGAEANRAKAEAFDKELAPIVSEITADRKLSRAEVAAELNKRGLTTSRGKPWSANNIRRLLDRIQSTEETKAREAYESDPNWGAF